jgi:hypothetical protein
MSREFQGTPLTEAASAAIDEWLSQVRLDLLRRARQVASEAHGERPPEITVRDILGAVESPAPRGAAIRSERFRLLHLISVLFAIMTISGALLWIGPNVSDLEPAQVVGLASTVTGLVGLLLSRLFLEQIDQSYGGQFSEGPALEFSRDISSDFMGQFWTLELALRSLNAQTVGETAAAGTTPTVLALKSGALTDEDAERLRRVIDVRNRLVHGRPVSETELKHGLVEMERLRRAMDGHR